MCLAIGLSPKNKMPEGKDIKRKIINHAWKSNPDGGGFAYLKDGEIVIQKGYMKLKAFTKALYQARHKYPDSHFLVHLRWASKGVVNEENTHPFKVGDNYAMIHNGTIYKVDTSKDQSDTSAFAEDILSNLPADFAEKESYNTLIEDYIGKSKVAILKKNNTIQIYNGQLGTLESGGHIWYSNDYYKPGVVRKGYEDKKEEDNLCKWCNNLLLTHKEKSDKLCATCEIYNNDSYDEGDFCKECGIELYTKKSKEARICTHCANRQSAS